MPFEPPQSTPEPPPPWEHPAPPPRKRVRPDQIARLVNKLVSFGLTVYIIDVSTGGQLHRAAQREIMRMRNRFRTVERLPSPTEISALHAEVRRIQQGGLNDPTTS